MMTPLGQLLRLTVGLLACFACASPAHAGDEPIRLKNPGFESALDGWFPAKGDMNMSAASPEAPHTGNMGLRVTDTDNKRGSSMASAKFDAKADATYEVRFWARSISGSGVSVYLQFLDAAGTKLTDLDDPHGGSERVNVIKVNVPPKTTDWQQFTLRGVAPKDAASVYIWVHSSTNGVGVADLDDFELVKVN